MAGMRTARCPGRATIVPSQAQFRLPLRFTASDANAGIFPGSRNFPLAVHAEPQSRCPETRVVWPAWSFNAMSDVPEFTPQNEASQILAVIVESSDDAIVATA